LSEIKFICELAYKVNVSGYKKMRWLNLIICLLLHLLDNSAKRALPTRVNQGSLDVELSKWEHP